MDDEECQKMSSEDLDQLAHLIAKNETCLHADYDNSDRCTDPIVDSSVRWMHMLEDMFSEIVASKLEKHCQCYTLYTLRKHAYSNI